MLRKYSSYRSHSDNVKLGALTAFSAGMVNVMSVIIFFAFTANVTGHYAILAQEIAKGNWYQASVTLIWIGLFFFGNFVSNFLIIHANKKTGRYFAHAMPVVLEIICLSVTGYYLNNHYTDTLQETEVLVGLMLFAMGLQNGLTASISNFSVKTTHLTGLTTDLGLLLSMLTRKEYRSDKNLVLRTQLLLIIMLTYLIGGTLAGVMYSFIRYNVFYIVSLVLSFLIVYDAYKLKMTKLMTIRKPVIRKYYSVEDLQTAYKNDIN